MLVRVVLPESPFVVVCTGTTGTFVSTSAPVRKHRGHRTMGRHIPEIVTSGHMRPFLTPKQLKLSIARAVKALKTHKFDAVAFRGMSGALIGPPVAMALGKTMLLVRKPKDDTHSSLKVEGDIAARTYIIVDDFRASGSTKLAIIAALETAAPNAKCLGLLEVRNINFRTGRYHSYERGKPYPLR